MSDDSNFRVVLDSSQDDRLYLKQGWFTLSDEENGIEIDVSLSGGRLIFKLEGIKDLDDGWYSCNLIEAIEKSVFSSDPFKEV